MRQVVLHFSNDCGSPVINSDTHSYDVNHVHDDDDGDQKVSGSQISW